MRIDYFAVPSQWLPHSRTEDAPPIRVVDARIMGKGDRRDGFLGSDHCPISLTLAYASEE